MMDSTPMAAGAGAATYAWTVVMLAAVCLELELHDGVPLAHSLDGQHLDHLSC